MDESSVSKWFPLNRAWFLDAMATWEDSWVAPIMRLLIAMWPAGAAMDDRDELLARTAKVPLKTWMRIREETGFFWVVKDGKFVQPFLEKEFETALMHAARHSEKSSKGGRAKQEKAKQRLAEEIASQAASSSARGVPEALPQALSKQCLSHTHAGCGCDLSEEGGEEKRSFARAVPTPTHVEACFRAYPRERRGKGATARIVAIPDDARVRIARFLLDRPEYPLLRVFRAIAKTMDFPPAMADVLQDPPHPESLLKAAGDGDGPKRQAVELDEEEAERARREAEWDALPAAEKDRQMREHQERVNRITGRKTA